MNDMQIIQGRAPAAPNEIVVDERQVEVDKITLGDPLESFGREYSVVGIFAPPSGSRIKMSLAAMQEALEAEGKSTYILVKVAPGVDPAAVAARIDAELPGNKVQLTNDMIIDAQQRIPALGTF